MLRVVCLLEQLEGRRLLSASLAKGVLTVEGTPANDSIILQRDPQKSSRILVKVGATSKRFLARQVKSIAVNALGGNDRVRILESHGALGVPLSVDAGEGNDIINGSAGNDLILGGPGNDQIFCGTGDDQAYGELGDDTLQGDDGNDTLGGDGEDRFWFKDQSNPAPQTGNDSLNGGNGDDYLLGGDESDTLHDQPNGRDTLTGGPGNDILDARAKYTYPNFKQTVDPSTADTLTDRAPGDIVPIENHHGPATAYGIHIHALVRIFINDGQKLRQVIIPSGIGDFAQSPVLHKHDNTDTIHMHDVQVRDFTLGELFRNWGVSFSSTNIGRYKVDAAHPLTLTVNGVRKYDFGSLVMHDHDRITVRYATTGGADPHYPPGSIGGD